MSNRPEFGASWRIIGAIAAKDIVDAIRNKTFLAIIFGVVMIMVSGQVLPLLSRLSSVPSVVVVDAGRSSLTVDLKRSEDLHLRAVSAQPDMEKTVAEANSPVLGLVFPTNLDGQLASDEAITIDGYVAHWLDEAEAADLVRFFQDRLSDLAGQPVSIETGGRQLYPAPDAGGRPFMISLTLLVVVLTLCGAVVPHLMIEEKEAHTLEILLVSPANMGHIVVGKALAGSVYGLLAGAVFMVANARIVVHWDVAILALVSSVAFSVGLGLLMGSAFDNVQILGMWFFVILLILLVPLLVTGGSGMLRTATAWLPSVLLARAVRSSLASQVPWARVLLEIGSVWIYTLLMLALTAWRLRRLDR